jgi:hypothetical protein
MRGLSQVTEARTVSSEASRIFILATSNIGVIGRMQLNKGRRLN